MIKKINTALRNKFEILIGLKSGRIADALYPLFCMAILCVVGVVIWGSFVGSNPGRAEWGEYFGGMLGPLLTFLTFMGLLITIVLQQSELGESRREHRRSADAQHLQHDAINRQSFEATFFQMLTLHNTIVNSIRVHNSAGNQLEGRECFNFFYTQLSDIFKEKIVKKGAPYSGDELATIQYSYKAFWNNEQRNLGHYYRYLYNIIKFVSESPYRDGPYIRLIRAQLSDQELFVLFYNCMTLQGANFKKLAEEFCLFDNMDRRQLLDKGHEQLIQSSAFM